MRRPLKVVTLAFALTCAAAGSAAQTAWPDYMPTLRPGISESPVAATLPPATATPGAEPAPTRAPWAGAWRGWSCLRRQCDIAMEIVPTSAERAVVAYAGANAQQGLLTDRAEGRFEGDELVVRLRTGARLALRLRADGDMEMSLWRPDTTLLSAGVLTQRKELTSAYTRQVERMPTPWTEAGKPVTLELVVYRPPGPGPFPTLVFNHGSTGRGDNPAWFKLTWSSPEVAQYFTAKGWQVMFPQRRGRGNSDGTYDEGFGADRAAGYSCRPDRALPGFERAVQDLDAVLAQVVARPDVDARRLLIGGVSRGGILAVGYAARTAIASWAS